METRKTEDPWRRLVDAVEGMPHNKVPRGIDDWFDFVGQVYNGGVEQYILNGRHRGFPLALTFLERVGGTVTREFARRMREIEPRPDHDEAPMEANSEETPESWDKFENWMYQRNPSPVDQAAGEIIAWMRQSEQGQAVAEMREVIEGTIQDVFNDLGPSIQVTLLLPTGGVWTTEAGAYPVSVAELRKMIGRRIRLTTQMEFLGEHP